MFILGATETEIDDALKLINEYWMGNIYFSRCQYAWKPYTEEVWIEELGRTVKRLAYIEQARITLKCHDCNGPGHALSRPNLAGRKIATACWHVHTTFFLELPETAKVFNGVRYIDRSEPHEWQSYLKDGIPVEFLCECVHSLWDYHPRNPLHIPVPNFEHRKRFV